MLERRFAQASIEGRQLVGLAAPFGVETRIADFRERIAPGAFARSLAENKDILCLADHDPARVLGRTSSGTLALEERGDGLRFTLDIPATSVGNDIRELARRGDLGGVSIGFVAVRESWADGVRTLEEIDLREVSIVQAFPAYESTSVALRRATEEAWDDFLGNPIAVRRAWLETCR